MSGAGRPAEDAPAPVVSVILPAFQAETFIAEAIRSALAQTLPGIEVIAVDDCSTDGTWEVILACARTDPRVLPVRLPCRGGPAAARNAGIAQARGRWLALLDADDLFLPERLARMVAAAEAAGADLLADNMLRVDFQDGRCFGPRFGDATMRIACPVPLIEAVRRDMPCRAATGEMFGFFQPIIRRDFLATRRIRYAEDILVGEDFLFYFACIAAGGRFHLTPEPGYVQRLRAGSLSHNPRAMLHLSAANRRMMALAAGSAVPGLAALLRRRQRQIDIDCFALLLERGEVRAALRHAHCATPARLLRHMRAALGALRRNWARRGAADRPPLGASAPASPPAPGRPRGDAARGAA
jgi:glycosyltransferase involved in cell wall biosynthesis